MLGVEIKNVGQNYDKGSQYSEGSEEIKIAMSGHEAKIIDERRAHIIPQTF